MIHALGFQYVGDESPLLRFSVYTELQAQIILKLGEKIDVLVKASFLKEKNINGKYISQAHGNFWLWILGAFEILRTMADAKSCWSEAKYSEIKKLKIKISKIRGPFAKQTLNEKGLPVVNAELSIVIFNTEKCDFGYKIGETVFLQRELIEEFRQLIKSFKTEDVIRDHREKSPPPQTQGW